MTIGAEPPRWEALIARGARFTERYGPPTPWLTFIAVGLSALPLLALAVLAARAARLRAALATEREFSRRERLFTQSVSHEFRTPLGVILSGVDLLESYADRIPPERRAEVLAEIKDNTGRMNAMLDGVLLLGRLDSGRQACDPRPLSPAALCRDLARRIGAATRDRNPIEVAAVERPALLDGPLLSTVLGNLLSNAVKYSAPGSPVALGAEIVGERLVFTVLDSGIGISAEELPRVCDPFHRCANVGDIPGTGLGLAIARRGAVLHGGTLTLASEPGKGTLATVAIPFHPAPPEDFGP